MPTLNALTRAVALTDAAVETELAARRRADAAYAAVRAAVAETADRPAYDYGAKNRVAGAAAELTEATAAYSAASDEVRAAAAVEADVAGAYLAREYAAGRFKRKTADEAYDYGLHAEDDETYVHEETGAYHAPAEGPLIVYQTQDGGLAFIDRATGAADVG